MKVDMLTSCYALCHAMAGNFQFVAMAVNPVCAAYGERLRRYSANWEALATAMISETVNVLYLEKTAPQTIPMITPGFDENAEANDKALIVLEALSEALEELSIPQDAEPSCLYFIPRIMEEQKRTLHLMEKNIRNNLLWNLPGPWQCRACGHMADMPPSSEGACECCGCGQSQWESPAMFEDSTSE